ncbi:hypothetical protein DFA_00052 [Cavenderia fasciculata]|uniref:Uncharacterized protein n=1 Tax=Cavenderia fasciculata TaxID=261658 RepID=F4PXG5_CACFS|nr:uncharacterized protein DFA_00052 [Cavenderia fasciculata]EGG19475.1 hypothetical protein DFA_00052 [Cavenderia fasciculata]|eukprot:XP_004357769.1 hypothetical protein DFA_00052 [Cavenderia fasciculata]
MTTCLNRSINVTITSIDQFKNHFLLILINRIAAAEGCEQKSLKTPHNYISSTSIYYTSSRLLHTIRIVNQSSSSSKDWKASLNNQKIIRNQFQPYLSIYLSQQPIIMTSDHHHCQSSSSSSYY